MKQFESLEEAYAKKPAMPDPVTGRTKKLVDEFVVSDIHTDRYCEKETENENGRRVITVGTRCSTTVFGKLYKLNGPSVNPLKKYVLFVGVSRQNPRDFKQDEELAVEMAAENAMVDPVMTMYLPCKIDERRFARMIDPYFYILPEKLVMTAKEAKKKKEEDLKKGFEDYLKDTEKRALYNFYHKTMKPLMDHPETEKYIFGY